ncbi:hypothetical protein BDV06DRAFT_208157 [Aspergillus oleicola]
MVHLPTELIELIVKNIESDPPPEYGVQEAVKLAPYTAVSRQWRAVVERVIWLEIELWRRGSLALLKKYTSGDIYRCARVA